MKATTIEFIVTKYLRKKPKKWTAIWQSFLNAAKLANATACPLTINPSVSSPIVVNSDTAAISQTLISTQEY